MADYPMFSVIVSQIDRITPDIRRFTLTRPDGGTLPAFTGGSHIIVQMAQGEQQYSNAYSLMNDPAERHHYQIGVRLEPDSRGGSRFMHQQVKTGDSLLISAPNNMFALAEAPRHVLIAGGIGITPFIAHGYELARRGQAFDLHYSYRDEAGAPFGDLLAQPPFSSRVQEYRSARGERLDVRRLLADVDPQAHIYCCGPATLSEEVQQCAAALGIAPSRVHIEQFAIENKSGAAFTLVLARSGTTLTVAPDMTILQAIEHAKAAQVECLCREGICGTCETAILEGEADHRDQYLSEEERAAQKTLLICCSRAKGDKLILDL
ncbi:PDR/VanB family oxidoreductase [Shimwellia blattae]|uniref:Carnitine monooxygenase reductase subunit n=1 Tax=Shimwellia blattae (strain ATCC 29907 / DSM 4481 / JCM 1650 / NBRC 105725 / CDC 9005-74) TaxID=630626 RepID=I2B7L1_SHIBC|nr:PDR/VanB family oxidoreductase [Shimwellia blattae]AFJ46515.1 putative dioxygenase subunit beta YeaX [Shimwellia blattae DSM 4481 = NBRC 105725]GAB80094.1 putative dioxygenase beta subunit YeaX [Shimwellia blattae DSM 4481 = NBRC 105725]VDY63984.1 Phthalate dioxygenase reductase [Shimwellia blattae]VEC22119.1 Phthalate dioxygenase reductase [Shimwellia blattae]